MFTHLLTESGFGASFELGDRTPKSAGPLPRQQPWQELGSRALSATLLTRAAD